jgi:AAA15 family ATPase/GTPase
MLAVDENKKKLLDFLSSFQLKYSDIIVEKDDESIKQPRFPQNKIFLTKAYKNSHGQHIRLNLKTSESEGTKKLFDLAGLLITAFSLPIGGVIILDELDSNFHPSLIIRMIEMFNNPQINKSGVQLIFTSHDTNLLSPSIMRRDQFYFTEKDENDATRLYSLADLKGIRNDADFARQYLAGFYGAVPMLSDYINKLAE